MSVDLSPVIQYILSKVLVGSVVAGVGALLMSPFKKAKAEWKEFKESIATVKTELQHQRTNCLTTLQNQGDKQIEVLEKVATTLEEMHLDQRTLLGRLDR